MPADIVNMRQAVVGNLTGQPGIFTSGNDIEDFMLARDLLTLTFFIFKSVDWCP